MPLNLCASHASAGDLTYAYTGTPNQYEVTFKFYYDCTGQIDAPTDVDIYYTSSCYPSNSIYTTLYMISGPNPIPQPCFTGLTTCNGGTAIGIEEYIYKGIITLPGSCYDWRFSYELCCRNPNDNILDPTNEDFYISAFLNNEAAPDNSSPSFGSVPVPSFCVNNQFYYNQSGSDVDGDSLRYQFAPAQGNNGALLNYLGPFTPTNPIPTLYGTILDESTGIVEFLATQQFVGVMCIVIEEYRQDVTGSWNMIGKVKRDMEVVVSIDCIVEQLDLQTDSLHSPFASAECGEDTLVVWSDIQVQCGSISPDGTDFRVMQPDGTPLSIIYAEGLNCTTGLTNMVQLVLHEPFQLNGEHDVYTKLGNDGNTLLSTCGTPMEEFDSIKVMVDGCWLINLNLENVTVIDNNFTQVQWEFPIDSFPHDLFESYNLYRSTDPLGPYDFLGSIMDINTLWYDDVSLNASDVATTNYNYVVSIMVNGSESNFSDSIQSILLDTLPSTNPDELELIWNSYWGWEETANPQYNILYRTSSGNWQLDGTTFSTNYTLIKPFDADNYIVKIETEDVANGSQLISESNWIDFNVEEYPIDIPNVFTPNNDGLNDDFLITNIKRYPTNYFVIYNRWGIKVFEQNNYSNDNPWKGFNFNTNSKCVDGVYFYKLKIEGSSNPIYEGFIHLFSN